ncbi:MAG: hypothetical protein R3B06_22320 [Kofleriaceae bacterium]
MKRHPDPVSAAQLVDDPPPAAVPADDRDRRDSELVAYLIELAWELHTRPQQSSESPRGEE